NYQTVKASINRLKDIEAMQADGRIERFVKKEQLDMEREREKLEKTLGGIKDMKGLPDALFIVDTKFETIAINEAKKLGIPVIAVVDTNNYFKDVDYIIPANDDAMKAIRLYVGTAADAILEGKAAMQIDSKPEAAEEQKKAAPKKVKTTKKVTTEKAKAADKDDSQEAKEDQSEAKPGKEVVAESEVAADKKVTKKATTKKTTTKKTTTK